MGDAEQECIEIMDLCNQRSPHPNLHKNIYHLFFRNVFWLHKTTYIIKKFFVIGVKQGFERFLITVG